MLLSLLFNTKFSSARQCALVTRMTTTILYVFKVSVKSIKIKFSTTSRFILNNYYTIEIESEQGPRSKFLSGGLNWMKCFF